MNKEEKETGLKLVLSSIETNNAHKKQALNTIAMSRFQRKYMLVVGSLFTTQTILGCVALYRFW